MCFVSMKHGIELQVTTKMGAGGYKIINSRLHAGARTLPLTTTLRHYHMRQCHGQLHQQDDIFIMNARSGESGTG